MKSGAIDAKDYILRKIPWDLSRPRFMDFQREAIHKIAAADAGFGDRLRVAALHLLEKEESEEVIRQSLTALAFVGREADTVLVQQFSTHPDEEVARFAKTCAFELKKNENRG